MRGGRFNNNGYEFSIYVSKYRLSNWLFSGCNPSETIIPTCRRFNPSSCIYTHTYICTFIRDKILFSKLKYFSSLSDRCTMGIDKVFPRGKSRWLGCHVAGIRGTRVTQHNFHGERFPFPSLPAYFSISPFWANPRNKMVVLVQPTLMLVCPRACV